jgi:hypothetical protein
MAQPHLLPRPPAPCFRLAAPPAFDPAPVPGPSVGLDPGLRLRRAERSEQRVALKTFIRQRFAAHYRARVRHFMPCLLSLESSTGELCAAVGLRHAQGQTLYLERYLDMPVDAAIRQHTGHPVLRSEIIEVGNLAAVRAGMARQLIMRLTALLMAQGYRWVTFTGTHSLINSFLRLGIELRILAVADPLRLGSAADDWGHYYDSAPKVMVGDIHLGYRTLFASPEMPDVARN